VRDLILRTESENNTRTPKYKELLDLHVCVTSRKDNKESAVVVTKFKGDNVRACTQFLSDWTNRTGGARQAFFDQVCDVCIGMLEDDLRYYHGDLRPANIAIFLTKQEVASSTPAADDTSTKPKATEQYHYVLTVIDWEEVRVSGKFRTGVKHDNFYPCAKKCSSEVKQEQLASAAYTACQLLVCIYILHRAAKATSRSEDGFLKASEVELNLRYCKSIFATEEEEVSPVQAKMTKLEDPSSNASAGTVDTDFLADMAKRNEYDSFQKWIGKMDANVFSDLNAFLTDQRRCTFDLLRSHLRVAIDTDLDE
jgi:hypothetical protein